MVLFNFLREFFKETANCVIVKTDVNFCKDHRDEIEVPDHLAVEDLISYHG